MGEPLLGATFGEALAAAARAAGAMPIAAAEAVAARLKGETRLCGDGLEAWESLAAVGDEEGGLAVRGVIGEAMLGGLRPADLFLGPGLGAASFSTRDLELRSRWLTWLADLDLGLGVPGVPGDPCGTPVLAELLGVAMLGLDESFWAGLLSSKER